MNVSARFLFLFMFPNNDVNMVNQMKRYKYTVYKPGCVFPMVVVSILPHAELKRNDHREDAPNFIF